MAYSTNLDNLERDGIRHLSVATRLELIGQEQAEIVQYIFIKCWVHLSVGKSEKLFCDYPISDRHFS
jgi:hypothetical protein